MDVQGLKAVVDVLDEGSSGCTTCTGASEAIAQLRQRAKEMALHPDRLIFTNLLEHQRHLLLKVTYTLHASIHPYYSLTTALIEP